MNKLPPPSEASVKLAVLQYLSLKNVFVWVNNTGMMPSPGGRMVRFGKVGSSDILGVQGGTGKIIAIELKRPGMPHKPTPAQIEFLDTVHNHGGLSGIATCVEDVDKILTGLHPMP